MVKATLYENHVSLRGNEANRLHNKGAYGVQDGELKLCMIEACYLAEKGRISVYRNNKKMDFRSLMNYSIEKEKNFEIKYFVYRDLRERGYVILATEPFQMYERGTRPPEKPTSLVYAISERAEFSMEEILNMLDNAGKMRVIAGIVDEEGDITYYFIKRYVMKGKFEENEYEGKVYVLNDRCAVWDEELIKKLSERFIGKIVGNFMQLSLMETAYVAERGASIIRNGRKISIKTFMRYAKDIQPDIERRYRIYKELRERKLIPKTGFKFGSHFRVYDVSPEKTHAPYLVHVVDGRYRAAWAEISRAIRLAHSVKKDMVFAVIDKEIEYVRIKRITP
ncbi:MAG: tRNA-intron lyase [Thermoplasmata archaeon]|nr:tRNA-intron lyase [Thermoplasmata archaeon]